LAIGWLTQDRSAQINISNSDATAANMTLAKGLLRVGLAD
jgi:hypothetical protein